MLILYDKDLNSFTNIEIIMIGGEAFPNSVLRTLQTKTNSKVYNMYGPTETTIWSSIADLTNESEVHIGHPIDNTEIKVLNDQYNEVDQGQKGEICIFCDGLARGYCNDKEHTNEVFISTKDKVFYRTGDIGIVNEYGKLECLGRSDDQIKLHGHRIELDEIDQVALGIDGIDTGVTSYYKSDLQEQLIYFYISKKHIDKDYIINALKIKLPDYMIPQKFVEVDEMSYTTSGKKNRAKMLNNWLNEGKETKKTGDGDVKSTLYVKNDVLGIILNKIKIEDKIEDNINAFMVTVESLIK